MFNSVLMSMFGQPNGNATLHSISDDDEKEVSGDRQLSVLTTHGYIPSLFCIMSTKGATTLTHS